MTQTIKVGILGYGNLGRGVEAAIKHNPDMALVGVFSRRPPSQVQTVDAATAVYSIDELKGFQDKN